jgi:hypothetical protein
MGIHKSKFLCCVDLYLQVKQSRHTDNRLSCSGHLYRLAGGGGEGVGDVIEKGEINPKKIKYIEAGPDIFSSLKS